MFQCEWTEFKTTDPSTTWRATTAGAVKTLEYDISDFKMIGLLVANGSSSDSVTHRQVQWYPVSWLLSMIEGASGNNSRILFNFTRNENGNRVWVVLNNGNYQSPFKFMCLNGDTDRYYLYVWGLK